MSDSIPPSNQETEHESPPPPKPESSVISRLKATDTGIPSKSEIAELAADAGSEMGMRLSEIRYSWVKGRARFEAAFGPVESFTVTGEPSDNLFELVYDENPNYNYVLYLPDDYDPEDTGKKWPVVYFFHGIGESGRKLDSLLSYGLPAYITKTGKFDMIMIAPQCPGDSHWADYDTETEKLVVFVDEMLEKYNIDADRMYLTGLSMGGRCTWKLALRLPETFAAIAPVCGRSNTFDFSEIRDLPVWMFHGVLDSTVDFANVNTLVEKLLEYEHRDFRLTAYPYVDHDSWTYAYNNEALYQWLRTKSLS